MSRAHPVDPLIPRDAAPGRRELDVRVGTCVADSRGQLTWKIVFEVREGARIVEDRVTYVSVVDLESLSREFSRCEARLPFGGRSSSEPHGRRLHAWSPTPSNLSEVAISGPPPGLGRRRGGVDRALHPGIHPTSNWLTQRPPMLAAKVSNRSAAITRGDADPVSRSRCR